MKVYVVTNGDYDELEIRAVFSTFELALEYTKDFSEARVPIPNNIMDFELDGEQPRSEPEFEVQLNAITGDVLLVWFLPPQADAVEDRLSVSSLSDSAVIQFRTRCSARDREQAIDVARRRLEQLAPDLTPYKDELVNAIVGKIQRLYNRHFGTFGWSRGEDLQVELQKLYDRLDQYTSWGIDTTEPRERMKALFSQ